MRKISSNKISFFFLLFFTLSIFEIYAQNINQKPQKIYVTANQLDISNKGIIVSFEDGRNPILARNLSYDNNGLYIDVIICKACDLHDTWCSLCGGCGVLLCPMNCKCFD